MRRIPRTSSLSSFSFGFCVSASPCDEFPRTSSLILSLLVVAGCSVEVTASCGEFCFCFGDDWHQRDARHSHHCEDRRDAETAH